jgi:hypothetical protein
VITTPTATKIQQVTGHRQLAARVSDGAVGYGARPNAAKDRRVEIAIEPNVDGARCSVNGSRAVDRALRPMRGAR